jgi:hypothetical protein
MKIYIEPEALAQLNYNKFMFETTGEEAYWITFLNILGGTGFNKETDILFLDEGYYIRTV